MPKISVILSSFNHANYLPEAIESVLKQSFKDFELIIWDDASVDDSWSIINRYKDARIRAFRNDKQRRGIWGINKAIEEICRGEYIAIQHSDDVWETEKLEKQVNFLNSHKEYGAVFTWAKIIDENGIESENRWFQQENMNQWKWLNQLFKECNRLCHPSVLLRKKCYSEVGVYRYGLAQTGDAEMWSRILIKYPVHVIQQNLTKHRKFSDKSNTSGDSVGTRIRANSEWNVLRKNYLAISDTKDLIAIFPSLERYKNCQGSELNFLLAMACLYECQQKNAWNFGLTLLYDLFSQEKKREVLAEIYSFSYTDFIMLTDKFDVYGERLSGEIREQNNRMMNVLEDRDRRIEKLKHTIEDYEGWIVKLKNTIADRDRQIKKCKESITDYNEEINSLNQIVNGCEQDIDALRNSTSWRITRPLRLFSEIYKSLKRWGTGFSLGKLFRQQSEMKNHDHLKLDTKQNMLPEDFDGDIYLKMNPDLEVAGVDPTTHYLLYGRNEGREFALPEMELSGAENLKIGLETILVVSHEASRTGAPILSLNLVQALSRSNNVIALLLGTGDIVDEFKLTGAAVITASRLRGHPEISYLTISKLCERFNFKFALVNSVESREVLPALCDHYVPTISLVHEFAAYSRPRNAFRDVLFWSGVTVFSANLTLENAFSEHPDVDRLYTHVLPQGRCLVPLKGLDPLQLHTEREHIRGLVRPSDIDDNILVVLGAGFVQLRKGVDLFIECAARMAYRMDEKKFRFVWIGNGYDPDNEIGYSVYIADQIKRAGLQDHVFIFDETPAIEVAFEEADIFLLSSRLDPLPNVAIDAMANGVPLLCFDKSTGISDFLIDSGLREYCVAEYLDPADMVSKILALVNSPDLYGYVAEKCREASLKYFNMEEYVSSLEVLAHRVCSRTEREKEDSKVIIDSGLLRADFSCPPHRKVQSLEREVCAYVRSWASGIDRRKPFPGFHPGIYLEQHGVEKEGTDPLADYLRKGRPIGPWNYPIIVAGDSREQDLPENNKVALHLHIYYVELMREITKRFSYNRIFPDLYISITNEKNRELVLDELKDYKGSVVDVKVVPNRGRDIGPFLTAFDEMFSGGYDFIGHIHTKKSADLKDRSMGRNWYIFMLENLLGGESGAMADSILSKMSENHKIGMVFPDDPYIVGMGANRTIAQYLAERIGLQNLPEQCVFPVGTMFWAKAEALSPMTELRLGWDDYPEEPIPYDGTLLHAIERLFPLSLSKFSDLGFAATNVIGVTR